MDILNNNEEQHHDHTGHHDVEVTNQPPSPERGGGVCFMTTALPIGRTGPSFYVCMKICPHTPTGLCLV